MPTPLFKRVPEGGGAVLNHRLGAKQSYARRSPAFPMFALAYRLRFW